MFVSKKMPNKAVNSQSSIVLIALINNWQDEYNMNSMKLVIPLHFIPRKKTPNDAVTPQRQSQFTPKMKANAVPRLLSSLV